MNDQFVTCAKCGNKIPLTEAITRQVEDKLRQKLEADARLKEKEFEQALAVKERELREDFTQEREKIEREARKRADDKLSLEFADMRERLAEQSQQLESAKGQELELRKRQRELEDHERNRELEMARALDVTREEIWSEAVAKSAEENQLKLREKDLQLDQMRKQIDELKRKAEEGSQQRQGEVLELELEDLLQSSFPLDEIEPIAKGKRGGDVLQNVYSRTGCRAGRILWEAKRTKNWGGDWISKLKEDQRNCKADIAVIVSEALPANINTFGQVDGVWVTDFASAAALAIALRETILQVTQARIAGAGKNEKMELLYSYLAGPQFCQRVEAIVESFSAMKNDLDAEKRAIERQWAKREKQIERVVQMTAGMYGDLQGIIGTSLPPVKTLELPQFDSAQVAL
ncbi:MAG TPA: DUF2130 domain-containing protein [Pyrinomonadaceae bacterium]|nr:DUF2130 domain-containing protein [Pyrinomonadaceae bacterium]